MLVLVEMLVSSGETGFDSERLIRIGSGAGFSSRGRLGAVGFMLSEGRFYQNKYLNLNTKVG